MADNKDLEDLLDKYYQGLTTEEETTDIEKWLEASSENGKTGKNYQILYLATEMASLSSKIDTNEAITKIHARMHKNKINRFIIYRCLQKAAAILFLPLLLGTFAIYRNYENRDVQMITVHTNPGMLTSVDLPDGTNVMLNSSSTLTYPNKFVGDTREVQLEGEAYFSVQKSNDRFIVNAMNNAKVTVFGTEFNVEAYEENQEITTTLVSGSVSFTPNKSKGILLKPGQKLSYDIKKRRMTLKQANVDVETSWKNKRLIFKNTPFEDVLKSLSKRYNATFIIKDSTLKQNSFTATFTKQRLERILEHFRISSNIHFNYVEDKDMESEKQIIEVY